MRTGHPPVPGRHLGLHWRPLETADEDEVRLLLLRVRTIDQGHHPRVTDLSPAMHVATGGDLSTGTLAGLDPAGQLRAVALVRRGEDAAALSAEIEPGWRGRGVGRALLRWQEACAQLQARVPAEVIVDAGRIDRRRLCAAAGFAPTGGVRTLAGPVGTILARTGAPGRALDVVAVGEDVWNVVAGGRRIASALVARGGAGEPGTAHVSVASAAEPLTLAELSALLGLLREPYAADDMSTARIDVDADHSAVQDDYIEAGMAVVADAVRYRNDPGTVPA